MIFTIDTTQARECIEITDRVREAVHDSGVRDGLCHVMALHALRTHTRKVSRRREPRQAPA